MFEENDIIDYDNICEQINKLTEIELEDLVIGQYILINFLPYSQRNIYKLVAKL